MSTPTHYYPECDQVKALCGLDFDSYRMVTLARLKFPLAAQAATQTSLVMYRVLPMTRPALG